MGIQRLTSFTGQAVVLGGLHNVEFAEGKGLLIHGVSLDMANVILNILAQGGRVQFVNMPEQGVPNGMPPQAEHHTPPPPPAAEPPTNHTTPPAAETATPPAESPAKEAKKKGGKEAKAEAPKEQKTEPPKTDDLPGSLGQGGNGPAPAAETKPAEQPKAEEKSNVVPIRQDAAPAAGGDDAELIAKLATYKRLGDILMELDERGFKTAEEMLKVAERVKEHVPVLKTIPTLNLERFKRALSTVRGDTTASA